MIARRDRRLLLQMPVRELSSGATEEVGPMPLSVMEAIEAVARGEIVIVTDDGDREN